MDPMPNPSGPERATRFHDPIAVALGNMSLFGAGYALLGLWGRAFVATSISMAMLVFIGFTDGAGSWSRIVLLVWWLGCVIHGWFVGRAHSAARETVPLPERLFSTGRQRLVGLALALPVLVVIGLLRVDAWQIERSADQAHLAGDCSRTLSRLDDLWFGHRLADAPLTDRAELTAAACDLLRDARRQAQDDRLAAERTLRRYAAHPSARWDGVPDLRADLLLEQADRDFDTALTGDLHAVDTGLDELGTVLRQIPDRDEDAKRVLQGFLDGLPTEDACDTARITGRLDERLDRGDNLDQALRAVRGTEPAALVGCGDDLLARNEPHPARERFEQLLSRYPEHEQVAAAEDGLRQATQQIQLRNLRQLLRVTYANERPAYCKDPAPYRGAEPYRGDGPHETLLYGQDNHRSKLPASWRADGPAEAVLVICAGTTKHGAVARTCPYEADDLPYGYTEVSFHQKKIPVTVYEVRTGEVVRDGSIQIDGDSCPEYLEYETFVTDLDLGPPSDVYVTSSAADVRDGYRALIDP